jgi:hypothetical protein
MLRPKPEAAPVIRAVLPDRSNNRPNFDISKRFGFVNDIVDIVNAFDYI